MQGAANGWGDDMGGWEEKPDAGRLADLNLNQTSSNGPTGRVFCSPAGGGRTWSKAEALPSDCLCPEVLLSVKAVFQLLAGKDCGKRL